MIKDKIIPTLSLFISLLCCDISRIPMTGTEKNIQPILDLLQLATTRTVLYIRL